MKRLEKYIKRITGSEVVKLDHPTSSEHGDYATNLALIESKRQNKKSTELAECYKSQFESDPELMSIVDKVEVAGPGFINFWMKTESMHKAIVRKYEPSKKGKVMVEFAHPNTHKAFHIGHLRNIVTGESLVRMLEHTGTEVIRANYQGDVGLHIAKALFGITDMGLEAPEDTEDRAKYLSRAYVHGNLAYDESDSKRGKIIDINKSLYKKDDSELNELYAKTRKWSLDYFDTIYSRLYSNFDRLYFESEVADSGLAIVREALDKGILEESEGAVVYKGEKDGLHTRVFITKQGTPTYECKDLGLVELQMKEYSPERIIHIVGPEQIEYFKVVFRVIEQVFPDYRGVEVHAPYGWVRLKDGKMSSRKGNVVLGEWLLDEAKNRILDKYGVKDETAEMIAVAAVKYSFLKSGLTQDISFDIDESISLEGNSGPYIQYAYARTQSVLNKFEGQLKVDKSIELNLEERALLFKLSIFNEVVENAAVNYAPSKLCNYLYELAKEFNNFYSKHRILDSENSQMRVWLTSKTGETIKTGLDLLGVKAPEKM